MFTVYTYQDWEKEPTPQMIQRVIAAYKASADFVCAITAKEYFKGLNRAILGKTMLKAEVVTADQPNGMTTRKIRNREITGNQLANGFFRRACMQQAQFVLGNGVTLDQTEKEKLGQGFDKALETIGLSAVVQGVAWGYWNADHIEPIEAAKDRLSGFVALLDEWDGTPKVGIQFFQLPDKPLRVRLFEADGITLYQAAGDDSELRVFEDKRPYIRTVRRDALGEQVTGGTNYGFLPVVPLFANESGQSEMTLPIKSKIDAYDRIASDFSDNLDRANDVYWVLNNFGGTADDVMLMLEQIDKVKAVVNQDSGMSGGASTAEPRTIEVPWEARKTAMDILEKELYRDFMALNMESLTGGSLTNVAIKAAMSDMTLKADGFEWQCFRFVQTILRLCGVETEEISFRRQTFLNNQETVQDIYLMRQDIDRATALRLNPYINQDEVEAIMAAAEDEKKNEGAIDTQVLNNALGFGE